MKGLTKILLVTAGSIFLTSGCGEKPTNSKVLREEDFKKAEWMSAPYHKEIWSSYMGEEIGRYEQNWAMYQNEVAKKNNFGYTKKKGKRYIMGIGEKTISLPDLDRDSTIVSGKDTITKVKEDK